MKSIITLLTTATIVASATFTPSAASAADPAREAVLKLLKEDEAVMSYVKARMAKVTTFRDDEARSLALNLFRILNAAIEKGLHSKFYASPNIDPLDYKSAMDDYKDLICMSEFSTSYEMTYALLDTIEFTWGDTGDWTFRPDFGTRFAAEKLHHPRNKLSREYIGVYMLLDERPADQVKQAVIEFLKKGSFKTLSDQGKYNLAYIWTTLNGKDRGIDVLKDRANVVSKNEEGKKQTALMEEFIDYVKAFDPEKKKDEPDGNEPEKQAKQK